ncbi:Phosphomannomutase [Marinobacterium lacunae]|uniref:phosphomannomutase n=1 Tax=Marinobacterium lacunae TaxID=1232683 RepID=A0A081FYJ9_9GAMM|nr:phosphomannomutase/phosphoglucomutase [Marinobacterium lacunae]KEA63604.1 Phosphomannomutase [Marinobacterium lacunae]MBR9884490.1 phosphomannomutase/phosphoglucomutase [Oceanospirillales bacterium]
MSFDLDTFDTGVFRAYDIRGIVGKSLTEPLVYHLGRAFAASAHEQGIGEVVVGADGRLSGPRLKEVLTEGLRDGGCDVIDIGYVPTPVLYFAAHQRAHQTGIMITGSHNPSDYNGFKMMLAGHTLSGDEIQSLRTRIEQRAYTDGKGSLSEEDVAEAYLQRIAGDVHVSRPLKVVVDCGNGIPGILAPELIQRLGVEIIPLFCDVDGTFPNHHPDPGKLKNLQDVIAKVAETGADLGLAFDGDGDRVGVVTEKGKVVYPDRVMMLFAEDVISRNPGAEILFDVKCSRLLPQVIAKAGGKPTMWKTGHSLIKRQMKVSGALLAGEMSGHIFFKERWYGFDDGLYSAVRLLEILAKRSESADAIFSAYPEDLSTPEINIEVTEENKFQIVEALQQLDFPDGEACRIDGVRVDYADGWGLVRASNTTPVLVLRFEAETETALERIRNEFQTRLHSVDASLDIPHD